MRKVKICTFPEFKMADGAILEIKNSPYLCNCSSDQNEILHEHADLGRKQRGRLKFAYFKNSRRQKIGNISATVQPIATKFCMNMQSVAVNRAKKVKICIFAKFNIWDGRHIGN